MNPFPALLSIALSTPALAQFSVTVLQPQSSTASQLNAEEASTQVGSVLPQGSANQHAARWSGSALSMVDINPPQAARSQANAINQGNVVGEALINSPTATTHAMFWPSGSTTPIDLNPSSPAYTESRAYAVAAGRQAGYVYVTSAGYRACIWSGIAASCSIIHPPGTDYSYAFGMDAQSQVGEVVVGANALASLWHGTAASWVNLNPPNATSSAALAVSGTVQVGFAKLSGLNHACLWQGTPQSVIDLHPAPNYYESKALGVDAGAEVGYTQATSSAPQHAALWRGFSNSWVDLHAFLPADFTWSNATAVTHSGPRLRIVGWGGTSYDTRKAIIWTQIVCGTADFDGDGAPGTDADVAAFFACIAGHCCPTCWVGGADFDGDGDVGTDEDIEAFFRVLAGHPC
jgi:hypothetical protein